MELKGTIALNLFVSDTGCSFLIQQLTEQQESKQMQRTLASFNQQFILPAKRYDFVRIHYLFNQFFPDSVY
jgi:hypothetical protein